MYAPRMNPYLPRPPSNGNSGTIVVVAIVLILFLIGTGFTVWYVTSTTPSPTSGGGDDSGGDGGDSPPSAPPGGPLNLCTESDPTKCCGSSDHCQSSEYACQCPVGKTYDCTSKSCVDNCTCQNGIAMKGKDCGNVPYGTEKCKDCNKGYALGNKKTNVVGTFKESSSNIQCLKSCNGTTKGACRGKDHCCQLSSSSELYKCCANNNTCGSGWDEAWRCNGKAKSYNPKTNGTSGDVK